MATHDYVIDNSTGANVRADINSVLQAILSNNSNSSSPGNTAAYMFWADTTANILKIRNSGNNAWLNLFTLAGGIDVDAASNFGNTVTFAGDVTFDGATAGRNIVFDQSADALTFADSAVASFGASGDFRIFHNGSDSILQDQGTGSLIALSNTFHIKNAANNETLAKFTEDSNCQLYFNNVVRFATTSTGAQVDGTFTCSSHFNVGDNVQIQLGNSQHNDFILLHDGTDNIINCGNNGNLFQRATSIHFQSLLGEDKLIAETDGAVKVYFDGTERAATVSNGFTVKNKLFLARETGTTADYANFRIAFYQSIPADSSHTFQVGSVHAMGTVQIFGSRGATANNATLATGKIFPIHVRSGATAGLGTQIGSDIGGASGGFSYTVAAASQGITITNGSSSFAMNTFVSFDLTGFVG